MPVRRQHLCELHDCSPSELFCLMPREARVRKRANARMSHQPQNFGALPGFLLDGNRQLCNRRIHAVQQLQQLLPAPTGPGELTPASLTELFPTR
jgi:hypothetical protein